MTDYSNTVDAKNIIFNFKRNNNLTQRRNDKFCNI